MLVYQAIRLRQELANEWLVIATGAATAVVGLGFIVVPRAGATVLGLLTGALLVVFGVLLIAIGWKLRGIIRDLEQEVRVSRQEPRLG